MLSALYLVLGIFYTYYEAANLDTLDDPYLQNLSFRDQVFTIVQIAAHLLRVLITWPLYFIEDICLKELNRGKEDK